MQILAWPLKRVVVARLGDISSGAIATPAGTAALVSTAQRPVEVAHFLPSNPERICVYGMPLRGTLREVTAEHTGLGVDSPAVEVRVRVYEPGEDFIGVDQTLGDMLDAVATAVVGTALLSDGRLWLATYGQDIPVVTPQPEPSITLTAAMVFRAEVVGRG